MKRLMYGSIAILSMALAFHLGAAMARSSADCIDLARFENDTSEVRFTIVANGKCQSYNDQGVLILEAVLPHPGAVAAVDYDVFDGSGFRVVYRNGEFWLYRPTTGWSLVFEAGCGFTAVSPATWGQIKHQAGK